MRTTLVLLLLASLAPAQLTVTASQAPGRKFNLAGLLSNGSVTRTEVSPGKFYEVYNGGVIVTGAGKGTFYATGLNQWSGQITVTTPGLITVWDGSQTTTLTITNVGPAITSFTITKLSNGFYQFSGKVADEAPKGLTITFSGPQGINGVSVEADANGNFSRIISYSGTTGASVTATVTDWYNLSASKSAITP